MESPASPSAPRPIAPVQGFEGRSPIAIRDIPVAFASGCKAVYPAFAPPAYRSLLIFSCRHSRFLSCALGSSRTNATRIADELEKRGWIERRESDNDRRCLHLQLTEKGQAFLQEVLPPQHHCLHQLWSSLSTAEKDQLEHITRKLLTRLDQMEQEGTVLEALR